jgi:hypothetical protein
LAKSTGQRCRGFSVRLLFLELSLLLMRLNNFFAPRLLVLTHASASFSSNTCITCMPFQKCSRSVAVRLTDAATQTSSDMETSTDAQQDQNPTLCRWGKDAKQKSSAEVKAGQGEVARIQLEVSLTSLQAFHVSISTQHAASTARLKTAVKSWRFGSLGMNLCDASHYAALYNNNARLDYFSL